MREYLPCSTANNEFPLRGNFGGRRGRETPIFPVGKVAIWIAKQDKFMAALRWFSPPKRSKNKLMAVLRWFLPRENKCIIDRVIKFEILAIPRFRLNFLLFYCPGGRTHGSNAAKQTLSCGILLAECLASQKAGHFPCGKSLVPPPAPLSSVWLYYGSKNWTVEIFSLSE